MGHPASGAIDLSKGDLVGAGLSMGSAIPVFGVWFGAAKKARKAAKAAEKAKQVKDKLKGIDFPLKRPPGVSDIEWNKKLSALNEAAKRGDAKVVHKPKRTGEPQKEARKNGSVQSGQDADHALDLQFGGLDKKKNIQPLDPRVNRSVGAQGKKRLQYPNGTRITGFPEIK